MTNLFTCLSNWKLKYLCALLVCLCVGVGNVWGAVKKVKYNVASTSSVNLDATINEKPDGSSATFSNTYTSTKEQMTSGHTQTLTLSSYGVVAVVNVTLSMKSNSGSGAGVVKYSTDGGSTWTYLVGSWDDVNSRESGVSFASNTFGNGYSTSYKDVTFVKSIITESSKDFVIKIVSTENSIFCQSYQLTYTSETYTVTYNAGSGSCGTASKTQDTMGEVLTLPSASPSAGCIIEGWSFIGWAKSSCAETGDKPKLYASGSSYIPLQSETLYAVYKIGDSYTINFEGVNSDYEDDWTFSNISSKQNGDITAHGGSYYGTTGGYSTASITTNSTTSPRWIKFYISKTTGNTTESYWKVQTKGKDDDEWTDRKSQDAKSMSKGNWVEVTQDLSSYSDIYVRISYGSNTAVRAIDDLELSCVTYNSNPYCCDALGAVNGSVSVSKTAFTVTATWPMTEDGHETGYSVQLYDNNGSGAKGSAIGDPVAITGTGSGDRTCTFGAKTPAGRRLTANHQYFIGVKPTYSGDGDYCPTGTEVVGNTTTDQTYTVTYAAGGGTGTMTDSNSPYEAGDAVTVLPNTFTKPGYPFDGWSAVDASSNVVDVSSGSFTMPSSNVTITATWGAALVDKFQDKEHNNSEATRSGANRTTPTLSDFTPVNSYCNDLHYKFIGWVLSTSVNDDGTLKNDAVIVPGGQGSWNCTGAIYYAVWAAENE